MKTYKRILAFALAALFVFAMCACTPSEKPVDVDNTNGGSSIGNAEGNRRNDGNKPEGGDTNNPQGGNLGGENRTDNNKQSGGNSGGSRREDPVSDKYECDGFGVTHVRIEYTEPVESEPMTAVVTSVDELSEFLSAYNAKAVVRMYDEEFFKTNALAVMISIFTSGSTSQEVVAVDAEDAGEIKVQVKTQIPEIYTTDMAAWFVGIAIPKTEYKGQTTLTVTEQ